jgi:NAD(P)-dependent dehydrogenase (short-subunit alcohol dehydrogenase family)
MIEAGTGAVVNVASMAGITGLYDAHAYTAAKGIRTNAVRPGCSWRRMRPVM